MTSNTQDAIDRLLAMRRLNDSFPDNPDHDKNAELITAALEGLGVTT